MPPSMKWWCKATSYYSNSNNKSCSPLFSQFNWKNRCKIFLVSARESFKISSRPITSKSRNMVLLNMNNKIRISSSKNLTRFSRINNKSFKTKDTSKRMKVIRYSQDLYSPKNPDAANHAIIMRTKTKREKLLAAALSKMATAAIAQSPRRFAVEIRLKFWRVSLLTYKLTRIPRKTASLKPITELILYCKCLITQ